MKRSSDIKSDSEDTSSSSSDEDEQGDKKKKKNLNKYLNSLCVMGLSKYFSTIVLAPHAIRCRVAQAE
jgi:hypothetical protein